MAAILFADIQGYTALMQRDEQQASILIRNFQEQTEEKVVAHNGCIVNFYGDGVLCIFQIPNEAVRCAMALQISFGESPKVPVRMGIHSGTISLEGEKVFGDSVNITSRIESMGTPGSILLSKKVRDEVKNNPDLQMQSLGKFEFKNVEEAMEVFALANEGLVVPTRKELKERGKQSKQKSLTWQSLTAVLVLAAGFLLAGFYFFTGESPGMPLENEFGISNTIAVFPFDVKGSPDIAYLGEGIVDLISTQLDEIPTLRSVDPNLLLSRLSAESSEPRNPEKIAELCSGLGASTFILGSIVEIGKTLQFSATKYNIDGQKIITQSVKADQQNDLSEKIDELIKKLVSEELEESGFDIGSLAAKTSDNLESLKFYLQGEQEFRNGYRSLAKTSYLKALELDSTFALAWMRVGIIERGYWTDVDNQPFRQWGKYKENMPKKWQEYYEVCMSQGPIKLDKYKSLIRRYGESSTFLKSFGDYLYFDHATFGASCLDAKPYLLRALELDPGYLSSIEGLMKIAVIENDSSAIQRYLSMTDSTYALYGFLKLAELLFMDTVTDQQIHEFVDDYGQRMSWMYVGHQLPENKVSKLNLLRRIQDIRSDPFSEFTFQDIKYGSTGREKEHYKLWKNGKIIFNYQIPTHYRCLPATFMGTDGFTPFSEHYDTLYHQTKDASTPWELYAAVKYAIALGLPEEARKLKAKLLELGTNEKTKRVVSYYYHSIGAFEARTSGDDDLALSYIDSAFQYMFAPHWIERAASRYDKTIMAANIYANKGDYEKAISFYNPSQLMSGTSLFKAYSSYQLSNWYEKIGDVKNSLTKCELFLESYKNCDEKYKPWVEEVKERRARLISQMN